MATRVRPHFDTGEKRFLFACVLLTGAFLGVLLWWGEINTLPEIEIPKQRPLAVNAFDDFTSAAVLVIAPPNPPLDPMFNTKNVPRKEWPKVYPLWRKKAWLGQNAPALKALRAGLPHPYQFPQDFKNSAGYRHSGDFYYLSTALKVESDVRAAAGDWKGATQSALDNIQFGLKLGFLGRGSQNSGVRQLKSLQTHLDATSCRSAARQIFRWHTQRRPYWKDVQDQKLSWQFTLVEIMRQRDWASLLIASNGGWAPTDWWSLLPVRLRGKQRIFNDFMRVIDTHIAAAKRPYAKTPPLPLPDGILGRWMLQASDDSSARFRNAGAETRATLLMVALALRAYRLEHGVYPTKLSQLAPNYLPQIPADPFGGGEELRYKRQRDSFILWSIGPDKKNDGGQPILRTPRPGELRRDIFGDEAEAHVELTSQGDWVYGKNR